MSEKVIVEKRLGIPADYQHRAVNSGIFVQSNWHGNKLSILEKLIDFRRDMNVLDLGIGSGNFEEYFHNEVEHITGVDYNNEAIDYTRRRMKRSAIKNISLYCKDIRKLKNLHLRREFDLVVVIDVIEHIKLSEGKILVKEVRKILKKDGHLCVVTPNYMSMWNTIESILDKVTIVPRFSGEQHLAKYTEANLRKMCKDQGFKEKKVCSFNLFSFLCPVKSLSRKLAHLETKHIGYRGNLLFGLFQAN